MERRVIVDDIVPARHGRAYEVKKGQVLRIYLLEDHQVGDVVFYNADDYREWFHVGQSWALNLYLETGDARSFRDFYSKPPRENVMLTVLEDTVKNHWGNQGARCSRRMLDLRGVGAQERSCQENLEEALQPYGLTGDDIGDIFNVFMNVGWDENGVITRRVPTAKKGGLYRLTGGNEHSHRHLGLPGGQHRQRLSAQTLGCQDIRIGVPTL